MHTEFSWIAFCLPRDLFSSQTRAKMQKGWRGTAKTVGESRSDVVWQREGIPETGEAAKRNTTIANLVRKREQPVDFYFNLRRGISFANGDAYVFLIAATQSGRARMGNRAPLVTRYQNSSRGSVESFSSGPKRFLHICNGSSNLCAFTEARPLRRYRHLHRRLFFPLNSPAPLDRLRRFGDRVPQFIFHAWVHRPDASNGQPNSRKRARHREPSPVSNCT